ncbi:hypothetical protein J6590_027126 [Homalodisca vitripennis]|nr:hypothetical protein J6590_027126 [Homalodisca vitripennis]
MSKKSGDSRINKSDWKRKKRSFPRRECQEPSISFFCGTRPTSVDLFCILFQRLEGREVTGPGVIRGNNFMEVINYGNHLTPAFRDGLTRAQPLPTGGRPLSSRSIRPSLVGPHVLCGL